MRIAFIFAFVVGPLSAALAVAQEAARPDAALPTYTAMSPERMGAILAALDPGTQVLPNGFELTLGDVPVLVVVDLRADRMRAMVPVRSAEGMTQEEALRVLQANFDTALDARYAIANGRLWSVFIHPFSTLQRDQFISGLGQTVNVAQSYGTLYSGGAFSFGSGDSGALQRQFIDGLLEKGREL